MKIKQEQVSDVMEPIEKPKFFLPRKAQAFLGLDWREFYDDQYNPVVLKMKNSLKWIIFNVPDCGSVTGPLRIMLNIFIMGTISYILMQTLTGHMGLIDMYLSALFSGLIGSIFFIRSSSFYLLKYLEQYQKTCRLVMAHQQKRHI